MRRVGLCAVGAVDERLQLRHQKLEVGIGLDGSGRQRGAARQDGQLVAVGGLARHVFGKAAQTGVPDADDDCTARLAGLQQAT